MPRGTAIDAQRVMDMVSNGMKAPEIAEEMGLNVYSVYKAIRREKKNNAQVRQEERPLGFPPMSLSLTKLEEKKEIERIRDKITGRNLDGSPKHDDLERYANAIKQHYDGMLEKPVDEPEETPIPEPAKAECAAPRLTEEDVRRTLVGGKWKYDVSTKDRTIICSPRVTLDCIGMDAQITIGFADVEDLARDLLEIAEGMKK